MNSYVVEWQVRLGDVTVFSSSNHLDAVIFRIQFSGLNPDHKYRIVGVLVEKKS